MRRSLGVLLGAAALAVAGCGGSGHSTPTASGPTTVQSTKVEVVKGAGGGGSFDPEAIYKRTAPGVVTVISVFRAGGLSDLLGGGSENQAGLGSGFVISGRGEIATNAHVVTSGQGRNVSRAREVYVNFADNNRVPAKIVGYDPDSDVALLKVNPSGLTLNPLPLGSSHDLTVGAPVAAIGSPFGQPQSLSVGVISALNRSIESLTAFQIPGAIQTDAAINHGNSGGPLVDGTGRVLGINSQIESTGGGGEGVGFAVPIDTVKRSLDQLRTKGHVDYAYLGVQTVEVFPQLEQRFHLPVDHGSWIQQVTSGGPARQAGLHGGSDNETRFEAQPYQTGGDIITKVGGREIRTSDDLSEAVAAHAPGAKVPVEYWRGGKRHVVTVTLAKRPVGNPPG